MNAAKALCFLLVLMSLADALFATHCPAKKCYGNGETCINNKCQCGSSATYGVEGFSCYNPNLYYYCSVSSDPTLTRYSGETSGLYMPGPLSLTKVITKRFVYGRYAGKCLFQLSAWTRRYKGKFFIRGLQFHLFQFGFKKEHHIYRITGKVVHGVYVWKVWRKVGSYPWQYVNITGTASKGAFCGKCQVSFIKTLKNFLRVKIKCCNIIFALRPFNPKKPKIIPGLWVKVPKYCIKIFGFPHYLCGKVKNHVNLEDFAKRKGFKNKKQLVTYYALMKGRPLYYPGSFPKLLALQRRMKTCKKERRVYLMTTAYVMFGKGKLVRIMGDKIMDLIYYITKGICCSDKKDCNKGIKLFLDTCKLHKKLCYRLKKHKKVQKFLTKACNWPW